MGCDQYLESISAMVDGEQPAIDPKVLGSHLATCPDCARFRDAAEDMRRRSLVRPVSNTPDMSRHVARSATVADRLAALPIARVLLALVAIELVVLSVIDLVGIDGPDNAVHMGRHLSAFTIAYAVLLFLVVARPARARTALPVAAVLAGALALTALVDLSTGRIPLVGEALHVPEVASVVLVWLLAVPGPRRRALMSRR